MTVKEIFDEILKTGKIKGYLDGPKKNVLVCETMDDWITVGGIMHEHGFSCLSPGGYGGSHPVQRNNVHNKIWRSGTLCASVIEKRFLVFKLSQTTSDYQNIHPEKSKKE